MNARLGFNQLIGGCLLALLLGGCATGHTVKSAKPTFFPPSPDEPRVQFLTAFSSEAELGRKTTFADYVTGVKTAANPLVKPYGLAIYAGKIYVCDTVGSTIQVFDMARKRARYFVPVGEGKLAMPINITIDSDGTRYIADTGRNQVLIFDKNDAYLGAIGLKDEMRPCDVAIAGDRLYVADLKGHAVRVYSKADRKLLSVIPADPKAEQGRLFSPTNLAVDREQKRLFVSDTGGFSVQVYDLDGNYQRTIGRQGVAPGLFARPKGVAVDRAGLAYVVDAATQVVQIFDAQGKLLLFFGQPGASTYGELVLPAAVKIDYENAGLFRHLVAPGYDCEYVILVTSQFGSRKVNVYGFLKKQ